VFLRPCVPVCLCTCRVCSFACLSFGSSSGLLLLVLVSFRSRILWYVSVLVLLCFGVGVMWVINLLLLILTPFPPLALYYHILLILLTLTPFPSWSPLYHLRTDLSRGEVGGGVAVNLDLVKTFFYLTYCLRRLFWVESKNRTSHQKEIDERKTFEHHQGK
jgi:hypothetical protein